MTDMKTWKAFLAESSSDLFLLLDGAAIPSLWDTPHRIEKNLVCLPLYLQTEFAALLDISPYLIQLMPHSALLGEFHTNPNFAGSGILFASSESLQELKKRLTKILTVLTPSYNEMFFRFYDPAVLDFLVRAKEASLLDAVRGPAECVAWFSYTETDSPMFDKFTIYPNKQGQAC